MATAALISLFGIIVHIRSEVRNISYIVIREDGLAVQKVVNIIGKLFFQFPVQPCRGMRSGCSPDAQKATLITSGNVAYRFDCEWIYIVLQCFNQRPWAKEMSGKV